VNHAATVQPAASPKVVQRTAVAAARSVHVQTSLNISSPHDPAEKEADASAKKIMRMAVPDSSIALVGTSNGGVFRQVKKGEKEKKLQTRLESPYIRRFADSGVFAKQEKKEKEEIQRKVEGQFNVATNAAKEKEKLQLNAEGQFNVATNAAKEKENLQLNAEGQFNVATNAAKEKEKLQRKAEGQLNVATNATKEKEKLQRKAEGQPKVAANAAKEKENLQRKAEGQPDVAANVEADIQSSMSAGSPLPLSVRRFMEPRFSADFSQVKIQTNDRSDRLNRQVKARAFTLGNQIFFGRGQFRPDNSEGRELIAHELTHTIQQGAVVQRNEDVAQRSASFVQQSESVIQRNEDVHVAQQSPVQHSELVVQRSQSPVQRNESAHVAQQSLVHVQRSESIHVTQQSPVHVQRLGISDALDYFADKANLIPGFRMFTIILGVNPINMSRVERSAANILRAIIELIPGGGLITKALDNYGVFDRVGNWVEQQIRSLGMTGSLIRQAIDRFLDSLSWRDIFRLGSVWERAKRIFTEPIDRIISFARGLVSGIIRFIKEAILRPLARLAEGTRGYDLLKAVLGQDPITGDPVPRTADTLIGGFMKLIGQEEVWNNLKRANAVARAWAWFQGVLAGLMGFVRQIPSLFLQALQSLEIADIVLLPRAFIKVGRVFAGFLGQFISWGFQQVISLLQIIFEVVAPGAMPYIRRAAGAFRMIIQNPIGFIGNLVRAGILGFRQFAANFLAHLRASLIGWLTGTLSGANIYIPQAFTLVEIIKFVLSVLGITWQNIRQKLVRVIGERAVSVLETGFDIVVTLVREGPAAAWEKIKESLSNLRDMVMEQIMSFVNSRIVQAAITRLITSLNPAGAFIQAIIAIYNTIMFFVERLRQIAQVAMSFIDSIASIASGVIAAAANRVEQTMGGLLTLVISFLARLVGLGKVSDAVTNIINRIRAPIDRALDRVVDWIVNMARKAGRLIAQAGVPQDPNERLRLAAQAAVAAARRLSGRVTRALLNPILEGIKVRYGIRDIQLFEQRGQWWVKISINPETEVCLGVPFDGSGALPGKEGNIDKWKKKYEIEGNVSTYSALRGKGKTGDNITPDHQPQGELLKYVAKMPIFKDRAVVDIARGRYANNGMAINLHESRHYRSRTYGRSPSKAEDNINTAIARYSNDPDKQRTETIEVLKKELMLDVDHMKNVAQNKTDPKTWKEINKTSELEATDKNTLITYISDKIVAGEGEISGQNLDRLNNPK